MSDEKFRVLVADDETAMRMYISSVLTKMKWRWSGRPRRRGSDSSVSGAAAAPAGHGYQHALKTGKKVEGYSSRVPGREGDHADLGHRIGNGRKTASPWRDRILRKDSSVEEIKGIMAEAMKAEGDSDMGERYDLARMLREIAEETTSRSGHPGR